MKVYGTAVVLTPVFGFVTPVLFESARGAALLLIWIKGYEYLQAVRVGLSTFPDGYGHVPTVVLSIGLYECSVFRRNDVCCAGSASRRS